MQLIWTLDDWARAVSELAKESSCPERSVLVPNGRVAHALRRMLIEADPGALLGTRFITPLHLALEIASAGGAVTLPNDRELGAALAEEAFALVPLERLKQDDLLRLPGWGRAFARTLADLEGALVAPEQLCAHADPQVCDVGRVQAFLRERGAFVSAASQLTAAAAQLASWTCRGPTLAVVTGFESLAEAQLLRALPDLRWALWAPRPLHALSRARLGRVFGPELEALAGRAEPPPMAATALGHLQRSLFGSAPGVQPLDDSLRIVTYAAVHEEVEAAVSWVVEQLAERGLRAQEIALLAPSAEPYAALLRARLSALPWPDDRVCTFSEAGVPLAEGRDGTCLLALVRALRAGLGRDTLAPLLPRLRVEDRELWGLGLAHAWELLNGLDAVGGEPSYLESGCVWPEAFQRALARLVQQSALATPDELGAAQRERSVRGLSAFLPAVEQLTVLLRAAIADAALDELLAKLEAFAQQHLRLSPLAGVALAVLRASAQRFAGQPALAPRGRAALAFIEEQLSEARMQSSRFGQPQVYLGTLAGARGLSFRALRVLGLVEGAVPSAVRQDPVLSDRARRSLSDALITAGERAERQLADFDAAVRGACDQLVLSAPLVSADGSARQPAAVLLDVVQTLSVPDAADSLSERLARLAHAGRAHERGVRERLAVPVSARLERIAQGDRALAAASDNPALSLARMRALADRRQPGTQDGLLLPGLLSAQLPGLSAEHPISATRLLMLLQCPHRYLHEQVLGLRAPQTSQPSHELDALTHGSFLHDIAERFWREHGARLGAREGTLPQQQAALRAFARARFEELRAGYPFAGDEAREAAASELCAQLDKLLELDWDEGRERSFVDVERSFGFDAPCALDTAVGPLHVRGKIDKLDRDQHGLLLRDIKTGKGKPRRADEPPELDIDLQLGLYARVAKLLARKWKTPGRVHVAYVYLRRGEPERSYRGADFAQLEAATDRWLATALEVLQQSAFVRSPRPEDCRYCPYGPLCAPELPRAAAVLEDPRVPRRLRVLKQEAE